MLSTMVMETDSTASTEINTSATSAEHLLFTREVGPLPLCYLLSTSLLVFTYKYLPCLTSLLHEG